MFNFSNFKIHDINKDERKIVDNSQAQLVNSNNFSYFSIFKIKIPIKTQVKITIAQLIFPQ